MGYLIRLLNVRRVIVRPYGAVILRGRCDTISVRIVSIISRQWRLNRGTMALSLFYLISII